MKKELLKKLLSMNLMSLRDLELEDAMAAFAIFKGIPPTSSKVKILPRPGIMPYHFS
jgi:hypothetical protein